MGPHMERLKPELPHFPLYGADSYVFPMILPPAAGQDASFSSEAVFV